jgi:SAM-dependent methyltransferase
VAPPERRRTIDEFDEMYLGTPPWDIGRAQPVFVAVADSGWIGGRVLDVGCGTGENALMLAGRGLDVVGLDGSGRAVDAARAKAAERGVAAQFVVGDALAMADAGLGSFDAAIDSGVFHVFSDLDRAQYVKSLAAVVRPGGVYVMCCFSDREPGDWGPRRVSQDEIRAAFGDGWRVESIEPASFDTNLDAPALAWLSRITRV